MYEFHGWISLAETPKNIDEGGYDSKIFQLRQRVQSIRWLSCQVSLVELNGRHVLLVNGYPNRRREESSELQDFVRAVAGEFTGAYGILYELDEQTKAQDGRGVFSVTTIKRGQCHSAPDPYLSPAIPVVEDGEISTDQA